MDRITNQIQFRKAIWECPECQQVDFQDLDMEGGNTYEHNCSACGVWFNNFQEYNGTLSFPVETADIPEEEVSKRKQEVVDTWMFNNKNQLAVVDLTRENLEKEKLELEKSILEIQAKITAVNEKIVVIEAK
jgi:hypothetical protein